MSADEKALRDAGWSARAGAKHTVWYCPCGKHSTVLPAAKSRRHGRAPVAAGAQAEVKRCLRDQKAAEAA